MMWSFWAITECEMPLLNILFFKVGDPEMHKKSLIKPFKAMNDALEGKTYLVGDRFTVADINVASIVVLYGRAIKFDFSPYPNIEKYVATICSRPKFRAARKAKL